MPRPRCPRLLAEIDDLHAPVHRARRIGGVERRVRALADSLQPGRRDALAAALKADGIPTAIYYTKPLHRQPAYRDFPLADGGVPVSEQLSGEVISLPMHAYLEAPVQDRIIDAVRRALLG